MATQPDAHPDSDPSGPSDSPEQVTPPDDDGRESVEGSAAAGTAAAGTTALDTAATGSDGRVQDHASAR